MIQAHSLLTTPLPKFVEIATAMQKIHESGAEELKQSGSVSLLQNVSPEARDLMAKDLRQRWIFGIAMIAIGIISAVLALIQVRFWRLAIICTSLMYLLIWYSSGSLRSAPPATAMQLKWMLAQTPLGSKIDFFIRDVALPLLYFGLTIFLSYKMLITAAGRAKEKSDPV